MTERKFTPPTEFPTEYVTRDGRKAAILGTMPNDTYPFVGYVVDQNGALCGAWTAVGAYLEDCGTSNVDLFDPPKKQMHWANDYATWSTHEWYKDRKDADDHAVPARVAVIRREWVEGQLPEYFTEEVQ